MSTAGAGAPDLSDEPDLQDIIASGGAEREQDAQAPMGSGNTPDAGGTDSNPEGASSPAGANGANGTASATTTPGQGPLTTAEQVAILDARLEKSTGDFDTMILEEQEKERAAARQENHQSSPQESSSAGGGNSAGDDGNRADAGGYSTGGGMGGISRGGKIPQNTAKYPPPKDIPNGNDDDVVARQLREAAMREPDPKVREKLWDEYRKYKGISQ